MLVNLLLEYKQFQVTVVATYVISFNISVFNVSRILQIPVGF